MGERDRGLRKPTDKPVALDYAPSAASDELPSKHSNLLVFRCGLLPAEVIYVRHYAEFRVHDSTPCAAVAKTSVLNIPIFFVCVQRNEEPLVSA